MKRILVAVITSAIVATTTTASHASTVTIIGYDITQTRASGTGGWEHTYSGTTTGSPGFYYDYAGGTGTMADGIVGTSTSDTQYFVNNPNLTISLNFDDIYKLSTIDVFGGNFFDNVLPGNLAGFDATIGGLTRSITTTEYGPITYCEAPILDCQPVNDFADLNSFGLGDAAGSTLMLSNFIVSNNYTGGGSTNEFSITEFRLSGSLQSLPPGCEASNYTPPKCKSWRPSELSAVPLPASLPLLVVGLGGLGLIRRRKKK